MNKGAADTDITAKLPKTQQVTLANGYGTAKRDVTWDVSNVDTSKPGEYTVTGTVDTIGANKNHWKWTNAAGESKTDEDDLINSGANANNSWKQTGGFVDNETANKNRTLYSSTAITVTAKVTVTGETEPTDPDLLADFTFDDGDKTFDGGNATGTTQGTATLADGKLRILFTPEDIGFPSESSNIKAAIIVPLAVGRNVEGTLKFYYRRAKHISETQKSIAEGFGKLLSTQMAASALEEQTQLATRMELKMLQSQINPHFLFNTINTIASLIRTDPETARKCCANSPCSIAERLKTPPI